MEAARTLKPRIFIDADVLFAGSASLNPNSASLVLLRMAEITLIDAITSQQVISEVERYLQAKIPAVLPVFHLLVSRCLRVVPDPASEDLTAFLYAAHREDLPILVAATREGCQFLATFNTRHYQPGLPGITVLTPGDLLLKVRFLLVRLQNKEN